MRDKENSLRKLSILLDRQSNLSLRNSGIWSAELLEKFDKVLSVINSTVLNFINLIYRNATDDDFRILMADTIKELDKYNPDSEDKELICIYFEKIMEIIDLKSSGGILNNWLYGFDPNCERV